MVYHTTFVKHLPTIRQFGLLTTRPPVWQRGDGTPYHVGKYVYAFADYTDAVLWGGKMGWEFFKNTGSNQICVLPISDTYNWIEYKNDPLGQAAAAGKWLRRADPVLPWAIVMVKVITPTLIRAAIQARKVGVAL